MTLCLSVGTVLAEGPRTSPAEGAIAIAGVIAEPVLSMPSVMLHARPASPGVSDMLPDGPYAQPRPDFGSRVHHFQSEMTEGKPAQQRVAVMTLPNFSHPVSQLDSMPLVGVARHTGAVQHINTDDGSMVDAFAICYRMNRRTGFQVIPGDFTPNKLPVSTMRNNMGVMVGMVVRLTPSR